MDEYDNKTKDDDETNNTDGSESISLKRGQQYDGGGVSPVRGSSLNRRRQSVSSDTNNKSSTLLNTLLHKGDTNKLIGREEENATKVRRRSRSGRLIGQGFSSRRQCVIPASIKTNNKDQSPPQQQCIISHKEVDNNDPQAELNNYCHDYFNNKQKKNDDSSNNKQHYLSSSSSSFPQKKKKKQIDPPEEKQLEPPTPTPTLSYEAYNNQPGSGE